jgi:hypothetical protein
MEVIAPVRHQTGESDYPQPTAEACATFREAWLEFVTVAFIGPFLKPLLARAGVVLRAIADRPEPGAWRQG